MEEQAAEVRYLFVVGCPRSGTTAMVHLLNADPRIVIGRERFKFITNSVSPAHFAPEHFFNPTPDETNYDDEAFYGRLKQRWEGSGVVYLGDKVPRYYRCLPMLAERFPGCRIIYHLRDLEAVASSYNVRAQRGEGVSWPASQDYRFAVKEWNDSLMRLSQFIQRYGQARIYPVVYDQLYSGDFAALESLYAFLEMPLVPEVSAQFARMTADWEQRKAKSLALTDEMKTYLAEHTNTVLQEFAWSLADNLQNPPRDTGVPACPVCGGQQFVEGPDGRLSYTGKPPRCSRCGALERDRVVAVFWRRWTEQANGALRILRIAPNKAPKPDAFAEAADLDLTFDDQDALRAALEGLPESAYDGIACNYVLQFVRDDLAAIRCMLKTLKPGGILQVTVPHPMQYPKTGVVKVDNSGIERRYRIYGADALEHLARASKTKPLGRVMQDSATGSKEALLLLFRDDRGRDRAMTLLDKITA